MNKYVPVRYEVEISPLTWLNSTIDGRQVSAKQVDRLSSYLVDTVEDSYFNSGLARIRTYRHRSEDDAYVIL